MSHGPYKNNFVYLIYNKTNRRMYIGVKSSDADPRDVIGVTYFSSSLDPAFIEDQKANPDHYRYRVLANFDNRQDALNLEVALHERYDVARNPRFYNMARQTSVRFTTSLNEASRKKLSESLKHHYATHPETKLRISEASKRMWANPERMALHLAQVTGRKHTEESRRKMSEALKGKYAGEKASFWGKKHTDEYKEHLRKSFTGRKVSDETRAKIGAANRGHKMSLKNRLAVSARFKGKKRSPEAVERMRQKLIGQKRSEETRMKDRQVALARPKDRVCPYCGGLFDAPHYAQYHGDRCKARPVEFNDEIVAIEPVGEVEMVDIEVNHDHLMYVNDILVHNCAINKTDEVDNSAIADSISLAATADMILMILQSEEMKEKCEALIKITKNRYTGRTDTFMMGVDYDHMRFVEAVQPFKTGAEAKAANDFADSVVRAHNAQVSATIAAAPRSYGDMDAFLKDLGI